jgi:hypothetical protein
MSDPSESMSTEPVRGRGTAENPADSFTEGGAHWNAHWKRLRDDRLERLQENGNWLNPVGPGSAFATAVACILLGLPAQYLPIFQR